jgi:hypothetical protein
MKMKIKFYAIAILAIAFATNVNAQATATASTTAVLVTPISIAKTTDMNFGTIAASATLGTVVLDTANARSITGGASLHGGTPTAAVFTVTGQASTGFAITIPTTNITLTDGATHNLILNGLVTLGASSTLDATGSKAIKVGATLNLPANAVAGTYTNASDLFVTVNYN